MTIGRKPANNDQDTWAKCLRRKRKGATKDYNRSMQTQYKDVLEKQTQHKGLWADIVAKWAARHDPALARLDPSTARPDPIWPDQLVGPPGVLIQRPRHDPKPS